MSELATKEGLKIKKDFGREALISVGGNRAQFMEVLEEYDKEATPDEDGDMTVERKEAIAAMKVAQWRLRLEIKRDQQQKEQLRLSQSKQVQGLTHICHLLCGLTVPITLLNSTCTSSY